MKRFLLAFLMLGMFFNGAYALPAGYTQLEYIQNTGTQYINTGITITADFKVLLDLYVPNALTSSSLYLIRGATTPGNFSIQGYSSTVLASQVGTAATNGGIGYTPATRGVIGLSTHGTKAMSSDTWRTLERPFTGTDTLRLFDNANYRMYGIKVYDGSNLLGNFVPAKNSSGVIGMYDTVSNTFKTNAGSGTFTAGPVVLSPIPDGYTQLDYIESTGTQKIDMGFKVDLNSVVDIKFQMISQGWIYGDTLGASGRWGASCTAADNTLTLFSDTQSVVAPIKNGINVARFDFTRGVTVNGTEVNFSQTPSRNSNRNAYLFTAQGSGMQPAWKIYSVSITQNGVLVRDLVPVKSSGGVVGMYDRVTNTFFTNSGSGSFVAGPEFGIASTSYVAGMHEAINTTKQNKLTSSGANPNVVVTGDANGIVSSFTANNGIVTVTRSAVTLPWGGENSANRAEVWVD